MKVLICLGLCLFSLLNSAQASTDIFETPISLKKGFILIEARIDGVTGTYILDTGAPGIILNNQHSNHKPSGSEMLQGAQGGVEAKWTNIRKLELGDLRIKTDQALLLNLEYLETAVKRKIDGLIGLEVFQGYEVLLDLPGAMLILSRKKGSLKPANGLRIPIQSQQHLPVATITINGQNYRFGIDTGSKSNLLCRNAAGRMPENNLHFKDFVALSSADQRTRIMPSVSLDLFQANNGLPSSMDFVLADFDNLAEHSGVTIDGILGYDFFAQRILWIDKKREEMEISQLPSYLDDIAAR